MRKKRTWNDKFIPSWLRLLFISILILGIFFRFVNLDRKVYWQDETFTSLRITGHTEEEYIQQVFNGQIISVEELQRRYQSFNSKTRIQDTINALKTRPEHPPFYFLMARFWMQWFGNSVAVMRSLPALISLLVFPTIYWLCLELFDSPLVGWVAVALIAVSPLHMLYAQEARQYSLWTVAILLSSASFLQAIRLKTNGSWGIYAITIALGLYSHLLFGLIAFGHGIYLAVKQGFRLSRNAIAYLLASLAGCLTFLPWLWILIPYFMYSPHQERVLTGVERQIPRLSLIEHWLLYINRIFHNADLSSANIILVCFALYSIYFVCRHTSKKVWLFILILTGVTALTLGLPDLILGGRRSDRIRYLIPCFLGIQLAVAYLLTTKITISSVKWKKQFWQIVTLLIMIIGVISCAISSQAETAWTKFMSATKYYPQIAQIINKSKNPLVVGDGYPASILSLSYLLEPEVKFQLVVTPNLPNIARNKNTDIFLFDVSQNLLNQLQQQSYKLEPIIKETRVNFWKIQSGV